MDRRSFLKQSGLLAGAIAASSFPSINFGKSKNAPPNVVFIICDQMRGDAMSCLGHPIARTPNLDKLASGGVLFENNFCNNPVCVPSRMSISSGMYPHQVNRLSNQPSSAPKLSFQNTMASYFKQAGYKTAYVGKNDTYSEEAFKEFDFVSQRDREPYRGYTTKYVPPHWHSHHYWPDEKRFPTVNTNEAVKFINNTKTDGPFFLHLSYFDPHPPYFAPDEYAAKYDSEKFELPPYVAPGMLSKRFEKFCKAMRFDKMTTAELKETMKYYYASIEYGVDFQVGQVLNTLENKGLLDNTIIVFTADHGDQMGEHGMVRKGIFMYDALLHVPMIWHAPNKIKSGIKAANLSQSVDILPTLIELTGGEKQEQLVGRSLLPFLKGEKTHENDFAVFASAAYGHLDDNIEDPSLSEEKQVGKPQPLHQIVLGQDLKPDYKTKMIRTKEWKYILNEADEPELYKMDGGYIEHENIAGNGEYTSVRINLEKRLNDFWKW